MIMDKHYHAALAATLRSLCTLRFNIHMPICTPAASTRAPHPSLFGNHQIYIPASGQAWEGQKSNTPTIKPTYSLLWSGRSGRSGRNKHLRTCARVRAVNRIFLSHLIFPIKKSTLPTPTTPVFMRISALTKNLYHPSHPDQRSLI